MADDMYEQGKAFLRDMGKKTSAARLFLAGLERDERLPASEGLEEKPNTVNRGPISDFRTHWRDILDTGEDAKYDKEVDAILKDSEGG